MNRATATPIAHQLRMMADDVEARTETGLGMSGPELRGYIEKLRELALVADVLEAPAQLAAAERARTALDFILLTQGEDLR